MEEWKDIEGFEGCYQISTYGRVRTFIDGHVPQREFRSLSKNKDGYLKVRLVTGGKDKTCRVHRLVAEAFIPNPENKETVNHIDGNKENNRVENLEWADRHEQLVHAYNHGLKKPVKGEKNGNAKFTDEQVKQIREEYVPRSKTHGMRAIARRYGVSDACIDQMLRGLTYA